MVQGLAPTSQCEEPPSVSAQEGGSVDPVGQRASSRRTLPLQPQALSSPCCCFSPEA